VTRAADNIVIGSLVAAAILYLTFIARGVVDIDGAAYFSLADDAMISMTYARHLAHGDGLTWNAGAAPVEGYTNLLWTLVMAGVHWVSSSARFNSLFVMLIGAALLIANAVLIGRVARYVSVTDDEPFVRTIAVALALFSYPVVFWTLRGFEVGALALLFTLMVLLAFRLADGSRTAAIGLALVMAMAVLVRTDAAITCAAVALYVMLAAPRSLRLGIAFALGLGLVGTLILHTAWRIDYYGAPLPNTYYLKLTGAPLFQRLERGTFMLASVMVRHLFPAVVLALAAVTLPRGRRISRRLWLLVAIVGCNIAYSVYVGGDVWERYGFSNRYVVLAEPLLGVLAATGASALLRATNDDRAGLVRYTRLAIGIAGVSLIALGIGAWTTERHLAPLIDSRPGLKYVLAVTLMAAGAAALLATPLLLRWIDLLRIPRRRLLAEWHAPRLLAAASVIVVICTGLQWTRWLLFNFEEFDMDSRATAVGVQLGRVTPPTAVLAVTSAGAIPYFADRTSIDLLGKSDRFIARSAPRLPRFVPGHNKWDLQYSIGALKPDVIVSLPSECSDEERAFVHRLGYRQTESGWLQLNSDLRQP
jgi:hypothetical protein